MSLPSHIRPPAPGMSAAMQVWSASSAAPGRQMNEDHAFQFGPLVGVLDGATVPEGFETGCVHGPAWYVRRLAARLAVAEAERPAAGLTGNLAAAILAVRADHGGRCDLDHPGTPSATVCLLRHSGDQVEYLVLCDSTLVVDCGEVRVISDHRLARAVADVRTTARTTTSGGGRVDPATSFRRAVALQRRQMNQTHGYWVAAADPDAAFHAVTGSLPLDGPYRVRRAALLTDGAARAVDPFALCNWAGLLDLLTEQGPQELIRRIRSAEYADDTPITTGQLPRFKRHDDATATLCVFGPEASEDVPDLRPSRAGAEEVDGKGRSAPEDSTS